MKKTVILWIMIFIFSPRMFADENLDKFGNICFTWQLLNYQENNQKINFINLNPLFYYNDNFLINFYENTSQNNNFLNNRYIKINSQKNDLGLFSSIILIGARFASWSMSRQERKIYNNMREQQREIENIYREIYSDPSRNFYQKKTLATSLATER
ncbi:MAG: hypothetical protein FWF61_01685 [Brevinematales bacterium]|nr:hypothetical protein [Brevinematales bacterium]